MPQAPSLLYTSLSFLLLSQLTTSGNAAPGPRAGVFGRSEGGAISRRVTTTLENDLQHDCAFEVDGFGYDLCPLVGQITLIEGRGYIVNEEFIRGDGSSTSRRFYEIALGGSRHSNLHNEGRAPTSKYIGTSCDDDTLICMLDMGYIEVEKNEDANSAFVRKPLKATPISKRTKKCRENCDSALTTFTLDEDDMRQPLSLTMSLYDVKKGRRRPAAEITFLCSDVENVRFRGDDEGVHSFYWATPHACPVKISSAPLESRDFFIMQESPAEEGQEKGGGDDDLLPSDNGRARRRIAIIVVGFILLSVLIFTFFTSSRARNFATEKTRGVTIAVIPVASTIVEKLYPIALSLRNAVSRGLVRVGSSFRQGESKLVKWAQEDMILLDEDEMVNGAGAYDVHDQWDMTGMDEYIPLTVSPRYGNSRRGVRSYGATPEVETFAERGVMHGLGKYFRK